MQCPKDSQGDLQISTIRRVKSRVVTDFGLRSKKCRIWPFFGNLTKSSLFSVFVWMTIIKISNTPPDRSAALVLFLITWTYSSCTGNCQIQLKILPEPDLARCPKNDRISDLPKPKSDTILLYTAYDFTTQLDTQGVWKINQQVQQILIDLKKVFHCHIFSNKFTIKGFMKKSRLKCIATLPRKIHYMYYRQLFNAVIYTENVAPGVPVKAFWKSINSQYWRVMKLIVVA